MTQVNNFQAYVEFSHLMDTVNIQRNCNPFGGSHKHGSGHEAFPLRNAKTCVFQIRFLWQDFKLTFECPTYMS